MIDEAELRQMTPAERRALARMIAGMDYPHPLLDLKLPRRHKIGSVLFIVASVVLVVWIVVLVLTLHRHFTAHYWRLAWVGFDFLELIAFAVTGWAFWRGRQIVIACLLITGTLLCCDAWFDVLLDLQTPEMWVSVVSALVIELPLAFLLFNAARRLIRMSALAAVGAGGVKTPLPSLWKLPLAALHLPHPGHHPDPDDRIHGDQGLAGDRRRS
ncbi:MAG: hypothetical protein FWE35_17800 [Streptosporangiales bacterium]|nr:hypothetical protein [Streptosporangiales bacterium]